MTTTLNHFFEALIVRLSKYKLIPVIVFTLLFQIAMMYIISTFLFPASPGGFEYKSITEHFITVVIVAPILETYIFQRGIINFSMRQLKSGKLIAVLLSATGFALIHIYSIPYMVVTCFIGILYGTIYLSFAEKKINPFWHLTIIHAVYNLCAFVINVFYLKSRLNPCN